MAAINQYIEQINDPVLRQKIQEEVNKLTKQKKFGLVFEDHIPECTPLYEIPVRVGSQVSVKNGNIQDLMTVTAIDGDRATCNKQGQEETFAYSIDQLVVTARFGEPIYPYLKPMDSVCNAPDSDLWHTLIQADNYHALQLLEYLYAGKVDCIYIDPPYNTGAKDWKYNNNYVDGSDSYRHSKWLSFMEKRLKLAKRLLNPKDSVLLITIDDREYLHLGCLLEEIFPDAHMQMISDLINRVGVAKDNEFGRSCEYLFIVFIGEASPAKLPLEEDWNHIENTTKDGVHWVNLCRTGTNSRRVDRPGMFYPIFVSLDGKHITGLGDPIPLGVNRESIKAPDGSIAIWPMHSNGSEGRWMQGKDSLAKLIEKGYVRLGKFTEYGMAVSYLNRAQIQKIEAGEYTVMGYDESGTIILDDSNYSATYIPDIQWNIKSHDAARHGTNLLISLLAGKRFSFPKSLYATHDAIRFFVANKPNALIVDFFAGSGTTLHAVNLLNAEDKGHRRCILVTNNEVSVEETNALTEKGYYPGDNEWDKMGIACYVTWPRTVCSIKGHDINGQPLKGNYIGTDRPMSDGFAANAAFFKLGFLDKASVRIGRQFREMLPTLWMKAGCHGPCPTLEDDNVPEILILPQNHMAVLNDNSAYATFEKLVEQEPDIDTVYLVTDSDADYRFMSKGLSAPYKYQLYRDYLDNFRINSRR